MSKRKDYEKLKEAVRLAQVAYHTNDMPVMSDYDYDQSVKQLRELEAKNPKWLKGESIADRVGAETKAGLYPVKHLFPMLSLDNIFDSAEWMEVLNGWRSRLGMPVLVDESWKFDGLACALTYVNGELYEAATRGDRYTGESILHNVRGLASVPKALPEAEEYLEVRGEIVMMIDDFIAYNEALVAAGRQPAPNPRNAAAGIARRLHSANAVPGQLTFVPYDIRLADGSLPDDFEVEMAKLKSWGFYIPPKPSEHLPWELMSEHVAACIKERPNLPFAIDGLVFRLTRRVDCERLGYTSRSPRWAIAYKFPPEERDSVVTAIRLQIGRTGKATPVAELEPVVVGGVTVTNASLHNQDYVTNLNLNVGSKVTVRRAGDVVPEIVHAYPRDTVDPWLMPGQCECGAWIVRISGEAAHYCTGGVNCQAQRQAALLHYVSRNAMDIDGIGKVLVAELVESGKVVHYKDLYNLKASDLTDKRDAENSIIANKLIQAIEASRLTTFRRFVYALGIPMVGEGTAKRLAAHFGSWKAFRHAGVALLKTCPDIGEETAESIYHALTMFKSGRHPADEMVRDLLTFEDEEGISPELAKIEELWELIALIPVAGMTPLRAKTVQGWFKDQGKIDSLEPDYDQVRKWLGEEGRLTYDTHWWPEILEVIDQWDWLNTQRATARKSFHNRPLEGQTIVITGTFGDDIGGREFIKLFLEHLGAKVSGSVSAKTDILFAGENAGSKLAKATELNVPVRNESALRELLAKHSM